jgi:chorismate dehydratase
VNKIRVGAVNYLNTKPLIAHLPELTPQIELVLAVPSQLADDLESGQLDVALIPTVEYFRSGRYTIVPDVSISSCGPVLRVKLCSRVPFGQIRSLALDEGSRTSIALATILLQELFEVAPTTVPLPLDISPTDVESDAFLVIGDRAMRLVDGNSPYVLDLGYEWSRWTGLPFVFAVWAVAPGVVLPTRIRQAFVRAKELGRREIPAICRREAARLGIDEIRCRYYLEHVIRHELGPDELAGLERFRELLVQYHLAPEGVSCVFHGDGRLAARR